MTAPTHLRLASRSPSPAKPKPGLDSDRLALAKAIAGYQQATRSIETNEARYRNLNRQTQEADSGLEAANEAVATAKVEAAKRLAKGQEDSRLVRAARIKLEDAEDKAETVRAAREQLRAGADDLR